MSSSEYQRLPDILHRHRDLFARLDQLEVSMEECIAAKRRRAANLLDETSPTRSSHLRLFVTHQFCPLTKEWTLLLEGRLLVGHLDHKSAQEFDKRESKSHEHSHNSHSQHASGSTDRSNYRGGLSEREGDQTVDPILFLHHMDRIDVEFTPIHKEKVSASLPTLTGSARKRKRDALQQQHQQLIMVQPSTKLTWERITKVANPESTGTGASTTSPAAATATSTTHKSHDAHALAAKYIESPATGGDLTDPNGVFATIKLYRRAGGDPRYKLAPELAKALFPMHIAAEETSTLKRRRGKGGSNVPIENTIEVPPTMTMREVVDALFVYIREKKLNSDKEDKKAIVNDKILTELFGCDRMSFASLQSLLFTRELLVKVDGFGEPIKLTYIMTPETVSPSTISPEPMLPAEKSEAESSTESQPQSQSEAQLQPQQPLSSPSTQGEVRVSTRKSVMQEKDNNDAAAIEVLPSVLSVDVDVEVPALYHSRTRELLRRVKLREFEYTSSRTRAVKLLGGNEDISKEKIEEIVSGKGCTTEHAPFLLALASAAPIASEARNAAQIDARIAFLHERLKYHGRAARTCWDVSETCQGKSS